MADEGAYTAYKTRVLRVAVLVILFADGGWL